MAKKEKKIRALNIFYFTNDNLDARVYRVSKESISYIYEKQQHYLKLTEDGEMILTIITYIDLGANSGEMENRYEIKPIVLRDKKRIEYKDLVIINNNVEVILEKKWTPPVQFSL